MPRLPKPSGPPHGGMDFSKSEPNADPPRATFVLSQSLEAGDRIMLRCERDGMPFDEDRTVERVTKERGRVFVKLEAKTGAQDTFDVPIGHRLVAVAAKNPIKIKSR